MADETYEIRKGWKVGSECLIYSKSRNEWNQGKIIEIEEIVVNNTSVWDVGDPNRLEIIIKDKK